jgi:hypothetical protein
MQLHTLSPKRLTAVAVIACAAALIPAAALAATASPASPARASASAASTPTITINSATLVTNGAAIQVVVTVTCGAGDGAALTRLPHRRPDSVSPRASLRSGPFARASHSGNRAWPQPL